MKLITTKLALSDLLLDPNNPHIQKLNSNLPLEKIGDSNIQLQILQQLASEKNDNILRLQVSITRNGFLHIDNIIVVPLGSEKYLVVEGNCRVAAIKLLLSFGNIHNLSDEKLQQLSQIEVKVIEKTHPDEDIMQLARLIQGLRHIPGTREAWNAFEQAWYITHMNDSCNFSLSVLAENLCQEQQVINRYYYAYKALMQLKADRNYGKFADAHLFNHFIEMFKSQEILKWLNWDANRFQFINRTNLQTMYSLICKSENDNQQKQSLRTHEDIRSFGRILSDAQITEHFLAGYLTLQQALLLVQHSLY